MSYEHNTSGMPAEKHTGPGAEKHAVITDAEAGSDIQVGESNQLKRDLKGRHLQMVCLYDYKHVLYIREY